MNRIYITLFVLGFSACFFACQQNATEAKKDVKKPEPKATKYEFTQLIREAQVTDGAPSALLVLMHGLGSNEKDLYQLAKQLDPRYMVVTLRAPHEIGQDRYSWYDLQRNGKDFSYSFDMLKNSRSKVINHIKLLLQEYKIDEDQIYVGGFSQGAIMSLAISLTHSDLIDGAVVLSGDLYDEVESELTNYKIDPELKIYMSHGRNDQVLPFAEAEKDAKFLEKLDINFESNWFNTAHTIGRENYISMNQWLIEQVSAKN